MLRLSAPSTIAALFSAFTLCSSVHGASINLTIVTGTSVTTRFTPSDIMLGMPAQISYDVNYDVIPSVNFSGLNSGDTITLDVIAPSGYRFQVTPEGEFAFDTYNRWFEFNKNIGSGGLQDASFSMLGLSGNVPSVAYWNTYLQYQSSNNASGFLFATGLRSLEAISFTGFRFTGTVSGSFNPVELPFYESSFFSISDNDYQGQEPPNQTGILSIVPEPSALSLLAVGLGGLAMMRRRRS
jgi:hypothetical protein